jgi:hypothetical protein
MICGIRQDVVKLVYPEDAIQYYVDPWWIQDEKPAICRGRLLWAFVPHVDTIPSILIPEGRSEPTDHTRALFRIETLQIGKSHTQPSLPVAALPHYPGEVRTVYRAKVRPVLVIGTEGPSIPHTLRIGAAKSQSSPTLLVAPYYGAVRSKDRGGWKPEFVKRIRRCEYPQYVWDILSLTGKPEESILRLDHVQPMSTHYKAIELTKYRLSEDALKIIDEWLLWLLRGVIDKEGSLYFIRQSLQEIDSPS